MNKNIRQTFGVINPKTGKLYSDIIDYHLTIRQLTDIKILPNSFIESNIKGEEGEFYLLHLDSKLRNRLKKEGIVTCIVSMQKRTYGNIAEARIYKENKRTEKQGELK